MGDFVGDNDGSKRTAPPKCGAFYTLDAVGKCDRGERGTAAEGVAFDARDSVRDCYSFERRTSLKCIVLYTHKLVGKSNGCQGCAI